MRSSKINYLIVLASLIAMACGAYLWKNKSTVIKPATIVYDAKIDFGDLAMGKIASKVVEIRNDGDTVLVVTRISASCSCSGLEIQDHQDDKAFRSVAEFSIESHSIQKFKVSIAARADVGVRRMESIRFLSNAANSPESVISLHYSTTSAGFYTIPSTVVMDRLKLNQTTERQIAVYDDSITPRSIKSVRLDPPELGEIILKGSDQVGIDEQVHAKGRCVGVISLHVQSASVGEKNGVIVIYPNDSTTNPTIVLLRQITMAAIEIYPASIDLARMNTTRPYITTIRSNCGYLNKIELVSKPEWLEKLDVRTQKGQSTIGIHVKNNTALQQNGAQNNMIFRVSTDSGVHEIPLRVIY